MHLKRTLSVLAVVAVCQVCYGNILKIDTAVLHDKIMGAWLGKTAGVCIGGPTEFKAVGRAMYTDTIDFYPDMAQGFYQDDIYVQVTFLQVMEQYMNGPNGIFTATMQQYGEAFKNSGYKLWHANDAARVNLKQGIQPPFSGMRGGSKHCYNAHADDIDFQIECDWIGTMCPAMPMTAVRICDSVGHVMNYGDGLYGGYFLSACDALAFQYNDVHTIVKKALECIPRQSTYHAIISDVVAFHDKNSKGPYTDCFNFIMDKYLTTTVSCSSYVTGFNINAAYNGAFIVIGLLYGDMDPLKTIEYATRCGQDSDCNPSNAACILGIVLGYKALPQQWKSSIGSDPLRQYSHTKVTWPMMLESAQRRAHAAIVQGGGSISNGAYSIKTEQPAQPYWFERFGYEPVVNPQYKKK